MPRKVGQFFSVELTEKKKLFASIFLVVIVVIRPKQSKAKRSEQPNKQPLGGSDGGVTTTDRLLDSRKASNPEESAIFKFGPTLDSFCLLITGTAAACKQELMQQLTFPA